MGCYHSIHCEVEDHSDVEVARYCLRLVDTCRLGDFSVC